MALPGLLAQLDPDDNLRKGRQFETLCRWYLNNAPEYRGQFRHVWLWDERPDRWGRAAGIDLVAETKDGDLWAIQASADGGAAAEADAGGAAVARTPRTQLSRSLTAGVTSEPVGSGERSSAS